MRNLLLLITISLFLPVTAEAKIVIKVVRKTKPTVTVTPTSRQTATPTPSITVGNAMYAIITDPKERESIARYFAQKYGLNEDTFLCTLRQESGINGWRADGSLKCGDNGASCGIGQIQLPTWISMRKHAGWSTEDLRGNDYENIKTTAYGMSTVWAEHWTGYRICKAQGYQLRASK